MTNAAIMDTRGRTLITCEESGKLSMRKIKWVREMVRICRVKGVCRN